VVGSRPVPVPVRPDGARRRRAEWGALAIAGALVTGLVIAGITGPTDPGPPTTAERPPVIDDPSSSPVPPYRTAISVEEERSLVVTAPSRSGVEVTTVRLSVEGYVVGPLTPVRISLQGRGNRIIETQVVDPARDPAITRPQRVARFSATFDVPNPRPNGEMLVEFALLAPDGQAFDVIWRYVRIGAVAPDAGPVGVTSTTPTRPTPRTQPAPRLLGEDGAMGGLTFRTVSGRPPPPATSDPAGGG
jgi:hypothetical protein